MAEYRIVASVDPQTGPGTQKVKQDLRGIQTEAKATETAINRSFDQAKFDSSVSGMTQSAARLDKQLADTATTADTVQQSMAGIQGTGVAAGKGVDQFSSALKANRLGMNQSRIGMMEFQHIARGVSDQYASSGLSAQLFTSHLGELSEALVLTSSGAGKVGAFLQGPWGIALTLATVVLGPMVAKLFDTNNALDDQIKKLHDDAVQADLTREAHERWSHTLDGLIDRQNALAKAMQDRMKIQSQADVSDLASAQRDLSDLNKALADERQHQADLRRQLQEASAPVDLTGGRADEARLGQQAARVSQINSELKASEEQIGRMTRAVTDAQTRITDGQILVGEQVGKSLVDLSARASQWGDSYRSALRGILMGNAQLRDQAPQIEAGFNVVEEAIGKAASAGIGFQSTMTQAKSLGLELKDGRLSVSGYRTEMDKLAASLTAAAKAAEEANRKTHDGVAVFTSAREAIGVAGRELQRAGLHVSENSQFGGVTPGIHSGEGHAQDRAIDVNSGAGIVEANVPDIRATFDAMARRYAARGYIVLWNGKRYDPSGAITNIPGGQDQHHDHMHVEAPSTIVGKPTQASTEAQAREEENAQAKVQERASDFVQGVVIQASKMGVAPNSQSQLNAKIDEALAEFTRRFNREATAGEKATITKAFTDADARETAQHFDEAYVQPLKRLQDLQGKTGVDRAVLNAQLAETTRLGRELTPVEAKIIENGIRQSDELSREAQLLEQIRGPMEEYAKLVTALNALLASGAINQTTYNARLADMNNQAVQTSLRGLDGVDQKGQSYQDTAAISDENARYAEQLANFQTYRDQLLKMGIDYNALELAAAQQHQQNLGKIDEARRDVSMAAVQDMAGSITSIMKSMFGEQSRMYKAAFVVEKAVAIARSIMAIQVGIAQAAALPFPANIPAIASVIAATASIVANIEAISLNFRDGGFVSGPGGSMSDSIRANLSNGEFVVNANATANNRALLERINSGQSLADNAAGATGTAGASTPVTPEALQQATLQRIAIAVEAMQKDIHQMAHPSTTDRILDVASIFAPFGGGIAKAIFGHADGGLIDGPGGPRSDSVPTRLSRGEFVVNARAASRNLALLEAINDGRDVRRAGQARAAENARVISQQAGPVVITTPPAEVQVVNVSDPRAALHALQTAEGKKVLLNVIESDTASFRQLLGTI